MMHSSRQPCDGVQRRGFTRRRAFCGAATALGALALLPAASSARSSAPFWDNGGKHTHGTITPLAPIVVGGLAHVSAPAPSVAIEPQAPHAGPRSPAGVPAFVGLGQLVGSVASPTEPVTLSTAAGLSPGTPSDSQVTAGGNKVVELVNSSGAVFSRNGTLVKQFSLAAFSGFAAVTDPRIAFDRTRGVFMLSLMEATPGAGGNRVLVAVSASSDPLGTWFRYVVYTAPVNKCADQPKLGYSADKIVVTSMQFNSICIRGTAPFDSSRMLVLDATAMRANAPAAFDEYKMSTELNHRTGLLPALPAAGAEATTNVFVVYHGVDVINQDIASLIVVRGNPSSSNVEFQEQGNGIDEVADPPPAAQPPGFPSIETDPGTERPLSAVLTDNVGAFGGRLVIAWGSKCRPTGDTADRACIRLVQSRMNGSATSATKLVDVALGLVGEDVFWPALTANAAGDVLLTYTRSSTSTGPVDEVAALRLGGGSAAAKGRTILRSIAPLMGPVDPNGDVFWGDYSGIWPDTADARTVWATPASTSGAGTAVGLVTLDGPLVTAVAPDHGSPGTIVTITGQRFPSKAAVLFGAALSTPVVWQGPEQLQATAPANPGGPVDVRVAGQKGLSPIARPDDVFTYPLVLWASMSNFGEVRSFDVSAPGAPAISGSDISVGGANPTSVAVTPDSSSVVVADSGATAVSVVNPVTRTGSTVAVAGSPVDVAVTQDSRKAWVALASKAVEAVDLIGLKALPKSLVGLPDVPDSIAVSDDGRYVFVTLPGASLLLVYDVSSGVPSLVNLVSWINRPAKLAAGRGIMWLTAGTPPTPEFLYPMLAGPPFTIGNPLLVGVDPGGVAVTPAGDFVAVTNAGESTVSIVNHANGPNLGGDTKLPDVTLDSGMRGVVSSPAADRFFIASHDQNRVLDAGPPPPLPIVGFAAAPATTDASIALPIPRACNPSDGNLFQQLVVGAAPGQAKGGDTVVLVTRVLWCFDVRLSGAKAKIALTPPSGSGCPTIHATVPGVSLDPGDNTVLLPLSAPTCVASYKVKLTLQDPVTSSSAQALTRLDVTP